VLVIGLKGTAKGDTRREIGTRSKLMAGDVTRPIRRRPENGARGRIKTKEANRRGVEALSSRKIQKNRGGGS